MMRFTVYHAEGVLLLSLDLLGSRRLVVKEAIVPMSEPVIIGLLRDWSGDKAVCWGITVCSCQLVRNRIETVKGKSTWLRDRAPCA
jgi:hypothetical protein